MRHGKHLGFVEPFMHRLVIVLDREMGDAYPEVRRHREMIEKTILAEENRFEAVLTDGLPRLEAEVTKVVGTRSKTLPGPVAFQLYDTFGIPYDFIEDTAATQGVTVDRAGYDASMEAQRDKGRLGSAFGKESAKFAFSLEDQTGEEILKAKDAFVGYDTTRAASRILGAWNENGEPTEQLNEGELGYVALAQTPFYLEAGGQVSDSGRILNEATSASAVVEGLARIRPGLPRAHRVRVSSGQLRVRDIVTAEVDVTVRNATRRNHTATHLLHAALREVLGTHVKQAGSLVAPDRLRFDFAHIQPVTREELDRIERIVNEQICRNAPVTTEVRSTKEAIASGAMALFGEKYGDQVHVVSVPGFSLELCGGTHVSATGDIGFFVIVAEGGVAAGVRRIEAITGADAVTWAQHQRATLSSVLDALHVTDRQVVDAIEKLQSEGKRTAREITTLKTKLAMGGGASTDGGDTIEVSGVTLARRRVIDLDKDALRGLADSMKAKIKSGVVVIVSVIYYRFARQAIAVIGRLLATTS
jgi:alanyl-tRNA synthetase